MSLEEKIKKESIMVQELATQKAGPLLVKNVISRKTYTMLLAIRNSKK